MRFTALMSHKVLFSKANALIDKPASPNFVCKEFAMANGFYKDCKIAPTISIRGASEQRISTTKIFVLLLILMDTSSMTYNLYACLTLRVRKSHWN